MFIIRLFLPLWKLLKFLHIITMVSLESLAFLTASSSPVTSFFSISISKPNSSSLISSFVIPFCFPFCSTYLWYIYLWAVSISFLITDVIKVQRFSCCCTCPAWIFLMLYFYTNRKNGTRNYSRQEICFVWGKCRVGKVEWAARVN